MYAYKKGSNWAGNNEVEESSEKCVEWQTKWVTNITLLKREKKLLDWDNGSAWQRVQDVIILFYLARVRL